MNIDVTLHFEKGFLSEPYWPEREKVISIRKQSGVDRARTDEKRKAALAQGLAAAGLTMEDYLALEAAAARPFRLAPDGTIVIPAHALDGMMAHAAQVSPAAGRLARAENIRVVATWDDLRTDKTKADGVYSRFIRNPITNQRRYQESPYIEDVTATGTFRLMHDDLERKARLFVEYAGREIGVGAARKLGWGRFVVSAWAPR